MEETQTEYETCNSEGSIEEVKEDLPEVSA